MDGWMDGLYDLLTIAYDERRKRRVNYLPWLALLMNRSFALAVWQGEEIS